MKVDLRPQEKIRVEMAEIILKALRELQETQGTELSAEISPKTRLYGYGSDIDSLGLVQLLIDVEERINDRYGVAMVLTDEKAMSQEESPFKTVESLAQYLADEVKVPDGL